MVSRRTYAAITAMMFVICFLFLLPQYVKETSNPYGENSFAVPETPYGEHTAWHQPVIQKAEDLKELESFAVFIGSADAEIGICAANWATLTKQPLVSVEHVEDLETFQGCTPSLVLIDPNACQFPENLSQLEAWNSLGIPLIFCRMPSVEVLRTEGALRNFLGIREIVSENVSLSAIRLFEGFLLGGERIYSTDEPDGTMDLNTEVPWVTLSSGTETYLLGDLPEDVLPGQEYRNEKLPALLWRRSLNGSNIFVVNGDYLSGNLGLGFLSAIMAENQAYYLYPIANAQVFTVASFPAMANENQQEITARYGKDLEAVMRDLLWPSLESMSEITGFPMSCFLMTQYDYSDDRQPVSAQIPYYLKLMKERGAEAGVSMEHNGTVTVAEKLPQDMEFLRSDAPTYRYSAAYVEESDLNQFRNASAGSDVATLSIRAEGEDSMFGYLGQNMLYQNVTHDLLAFIDSQDLKLLSEQTAVGYTNVLLDMRRVSWPEPGEPGWEVYYERAASVLQTHWRMFRDFDRLTISGSDARIRNFLTMDFRQQRTGDTIRAQIDSFDTEAFFILRTHKEEIKAVTGGSFRKLEKNAWLIRAEQPEIEIQLEINEMYHN